MGQTTKKTNFCARWVQPFLILLLLCGVAGLGYEGYRLKRAFAQRALQHKQDLQILSSRLNQKQQQQHKTLRRSVKQLAHQVKLLVPENTYIWQLYEAQHLLRLANFYSQFYDLKTAIQLMDEADKLLYTLDLPRLARLRAALAADRAALRLVKAPDVEGTWFILEELIEQVPALKLEGAFHGQDFKSLVGSQEIPHTANPTTSVDLVAWKAALVKTWEDLKQLVKIRRHTQAIPQLLSPKARMLSREALISSLTQIQAALLRREAVVYRTTVLRTQGFILNSFREDDPQVKHMIATLEKLSAINVQPQIPEMVQSLVQMERAIAVSKTGVRS